MKINLRSTNVHCKIRTYWNARVCIDSGLFELIVAASKSFPISDENRDRVASTISRTELPFSSALRPLANLFAPVCEKENRTIDRGYVILMCTSRMNWRIAYRVPRNGVRWCSIARARHAVNRKSVVFSLLSCAHGPDIEWLART